MNGTLGTYLLGGSLIALTATVIAALRALRAGDDRFLAWARRGLLLNVLFVTAAALVLFRALVNDDFSLAYIARFTEKALPTGYKLAAFWAGQEGSLLLWAWLLAVMSAVGALTIKTTGKALAVTTIALATVCGFFSLVMLFGDANPFAASAQIPADGNGLNPMLQDLGMIVHPPLLFIGYAGFTVPLALLLGSLAERRTDSTWLDDSRRWLLFAWLFLTAGIIVGAWWAYTTLGWGGYWAWDPVENASLLPWLTATALVHSAMAQQHRGLFKRWNAVLGVATFELCILGTFITRSGVVQSLHSFGDSLVSKFFLTFLVLSTLAIAALLVTRWRSLRGERKVESMISREGAFLAANVLLVAMTAITLVGTIFPVISGLFSHEQVTVNQPFYNKAVLPLGLALLAVMAVAPVLGYGKDAARRAGRLLIVPAFAAVIGLLVAVLVGVRGAWALTCVAVGVLAVASTVASFVQVWWLRVRGTNAGWLRTAVELIDANHRRYGGQLVHVGMVMVMAGVAGSSLFGIKDTVQLDAGKSATVGRYMITFDKLAQTEHGNYTAVTATIAVTDSRGRTIEMSPRQRFFHKFEQPSAEVAVASTLSEDLYVTLPDYAADGKYAVLQVVINPLVSWIWVGGVVIALGGVFCMLPKLTAVTAATTSTPTCTPLTVTIAKTDTPAVETAPATAPTAATTSRRQNRADRRRAKFAH